jgi:hypothetical protein
MVIITKIEVIIQEVMKMIIIIIKSRKKIVAIKQYTCICIYKGCNTYYNA